MLYKVRYFDPAAARVVEEAIDEASESALRERLQAGRRVVLNLSAAGSPGLPRFTSATTGFDAAWWCRELRTLLKAGMTVVEALETLQAQSGGGARWRIQDQMLRALHEGQSLSKAMRGSAAFADVLVASVAASERTSTLVEALDDYLRYDDMLGALRKKAVSAAIYPALVLALGGAISVFLLVYVIPRFSRMYTQSYHDLSAATEWVLWLSRLMNEHLPALLAVLGALAAVAVLVWRQGWAARAASYLAEQFGPLARRIDEYRLAKLYQSLALMFKGGYTLDEALQVSQCLDLGRRIGQGVHDARREINRGRAVATSFSQAGLTDAVSVRLLAVGERTGAFTTVLQTISDRHADRFSTFVERAARILEPLLLLLVALMVGGIVVMMYMPIFDIARSVR